jgi:hypothetical protein
MQPNRRATERRFAGHRPKRSDFDRHIGAALAGRHAVDPTHRRSCLPSKRLRRTDSLNVLRYFVRSGTYAVPEAGCRSRGLTALERSASFIRPGPSRCAGQLRGAAGHEGLVRHDARRVLGGGCATARAAHCGGLIPLAPHSPAEVPPKTRETRTGRPITAVTTPPTTSATLTLTVPMRARPGRRQPDRRLFRYICIYDNPSVTCGRRVGELRQAPRKQIGHGGLGAQGPFPSSDLPALG